MKFCDMKFTSKGKLDLQKKYRLSENWRSAPDFTGRKKQFSSKPWNKPTVTNDKLLLPVRKVIALLFLFYFRFALYLLCISQSPLWVSLSKFLSTSSCGTFKSAFLAFALEKRSHWEAYNTHKRGLSIKSFSLPQLCPKKIVMIQLRNGLGCFC